jgi:hypothetical protein
MKNDYEVLFNAFVGNPEPCGTDSIPAIKVGWGYQVIFKFSKDKSLERIELEHEPGKTSYLVMRSAAEK